MVFPEKRRECLQRIAVRLTRQPSSEREVEVALGLHTFSSGKPLDQRVRIVCDPF
jgi:hypothetical protein